ncbi:MAG: integrase arm-type DNA-binding domain-containing protein, partial [Curvibacter sp.]
MLTDTQCRAARPREKACKLTDGSGLVLEVKPNGVKAWRYRFKLTTAARKNGPSVAAEAKRSMAGVFELAMATLRVDRDPVYPVRRALPPNKTQHKRALEPDEIGRLLRDMTGHGGRHETLAAFRLM